jgi:hypothetical protein
MQSNQYFKKLHSLSCSASSQNTCLTTSISAVNSLYYDYFARARWGLGIVRQIGIGMVDAGWWQ